MTLGRRIMVCLTMQTEKGREPLDLTSRRGMIVAIQEDQAGELGLYRLHLKYYNKRALKRLLNLKPSIAILGSSHIIVHVILVLTDDGSVTNYRLLE